MEKRKSRKPTFKQMAYETAIRNPERYKTILTAIVEYEGRILNDSVLLEIVSDLYLQSIVSSPNLNISDGTLIEDIKEQVAFLNSTRNADGGFPKGYQSRFWTYMRTLSELGFVYARYNEHLLISDIAKKLVTEEIDEQQAFGIQLLLSNRKSPYRNVLNDYNYFRFILKVLLNLYQNKKRLSYHEFIVSTLSENGNVDDFLTLISSKSFLSYDDVYSYTKTIDITLNKAATMLTDYPDVVLRILRITGFITVISKGQTFIEINTEKIDLLHTLLEIKYDLSDQEKCIDRLFYEKINSSYTPFLKVLCQYDERLKSSKLNINKKLKGIVNQYDLTEILLSNYLQTVDKKSVPEEFKYIPKPLLLEFFITLLIFIKYGKQFEVQPNYKMDALGMPISHAPGHKGDIEVFNTTLFWLIEVTLIKSKDQQLNLETTSVIRHLDQKNINSVNKVKYLSFVAPIVHPDTKKFFDYCIYDNKRNKLKIYLKAYNLNDFLDITMKINNLKDMETYTKKMAK
ncbi:MAG: AlwI family type II restriction endonuclease [Candidatus Cloacimonetes bacterium]|nr:AlwI family type II restriction endonuclease [Candidatus Cloacimonadota bacterium]